MRVFVWVLRIFALTLFALMIFPAGFNTFFGHGDTIAWSETYIYLVGLLISAYCVRMAWAEGPTRWRIACGYMVVAGMLTVLFASGFLTVLDT